MTSSSGPPAARSPLARPPRRRPGLARRRRAVHLLVGADHRGDRRARPGDRVLALLPRLGGHRAVGAAAASARGAADDAARVVAGGQRGPAARRPLRHVDPVAAVHHRRVVHRPRRDAAGVGGAHRPSARAPSSRGRPGSASGSRWSACSSSRASTSRWIPRHLIGDVLALVGGMLAAAYVTVAESARRTVSTATLTIGAVRLGGRPAAGPVPRRRPAAVGLLRAGVGA